MNSTTQAVSPTVKGVSVSSTGSDSFPGTSTVDDPPREAGSAAITALRVFSVGRWPRSSASTCSSNASRSFSRPKWSRAFRAPSEQPRYVAARLTEYPSI